MKLKLKLSATIFPAFAALFSWVGISSDNLMAAAGAAPVIGLALVLAAAASYSVTMFAAQWGER